MKQLWDGINGWGKHEAESWFNRHPAGATVMLVVITILLAIVLFLLVNQEVRGASLVPSVASNPVYVNSHAYGSTVAPCGGTANCQMTLSYSAGNALVIYSHEYCDGFVAHITAINDGWGDTFTKRSYLYSTAWCGAGNQIYSEIWTAFPVHVGSSINVTYSKAPSTLNFLVAQFSNVNTFLGNNTAFNPSGSATSASITVPGSDWSSSIMTEAPPQTITVTAGTEIAHETDDYSLARSIEIYNPGANNAISWGAGAYWAAVSVWLTYIAPVPVVTTIAASSIAEFSAVLNGNLNSTGGYATAIVGFLISQSISMTGATNITVSNVQAVGAFTYSDVSLFTATTYYFEAWAKNAGGAFATGVILSFTTTSTFPTQTQIWNWFWIVIFVAICITALILSNEVRGYRRSRSGGRNG